MAASEKRPSSAKRPLLGQIDRMKVFLDFEAWSLSDQSSPVEVGWGIPERPVKSHLDRPAPAWTD